MAVAATRARALGLYRRLLRTANTWRGPPEEANYIRGEARELFRRNRGVADVAAIERLLFEGESRLELGVHYQIPYPRLHNLPTGTVVAAKERAPSVEMGSLDNDGEEEDIPALRTKRRH